MEDVCPKCGKSGLIRTDLFYVKCPHCKKKSSMKQVDDASADRLVERWKLR